MRFPKYIYEVFHEGPCGSYPIGFFYYVEDAQKAKEEWDKTHDHPWDKAYVKRHEIK